VEEKVEVVATEIGNLRRHVSRCSRFGRVSLSGGPGMGFRLKGSPLQQHARTGTRC